jgi:C4-dicarboxylate-specific signal transduction histidine kinase
MIDTVELSAEPERPGGPTTERLAHLGRLCAAGEFAAGLAHELHQPLCSIAIYADTCLRLLTTRGVDPTVLHDALGDVRREAMRAAAVSKQLRRFVRKQGPAVRPVGIIPLVDHALAMTEYDAHNQKVATRNCIDASVPPVMVEPVQIEQVLYNLVRNALDALCSQRPPSPEILVEARPRDPGMLEIDVTNSGGPVPPEVRQHMFEPFFSTKENGLGVGLFLARTIITAHRGTIECLSNSERTTLRFTLPVAV